MTSTSFSQHARNRVTSRLGTLVTRSDLDKIARKNTELQKMSKAYFMVKKFDQVHHINEKGYTGGDGRGINGDCIVAVFKHGRVATVMLAKSWASKYFSDAPMVH